MYYYKEELINVIKPDKPDPAAAKVLQEILGGHFGEMRTMMQFFFQSSHFRGKDTQFCDLLLSINNSNKGILTIPPPTLLIRLRYFPNHLLIFSMKKVR